ncbi:hypothetical protein Tco_0547564, partial [Tanacetum coccineum]
SSSLIRSSTSSLLICFSTFSPNLGCKSKLPQSALTSEFYKGLMHVAFRCFDNDDSCLCFNGSKNRVSGVWLGFSESRLLGATRWKRTGQETSRKKGFGRLFLLTLIKTWEELFENTMPSSPNEKNSIRPKVAAFSVVYDGVQRMDENWSSDLVLFQNALAEFQTVYRRPFTMVACWRILKNSFLGQKLKVPT